MNWKDWKFFVLIVILSLTTLAWIVAKMVRPIKVAPVELTFVEAPQYSRAELACVRRTVYGEARGEPLSAQVAVAATILTRSKSPAWPTNLCAVVRQPKQFAGYKRTIALGNDLDAVSWDMARDATNMAIEMYSDLPDVYKKAKFFHDISGSAKWSSRYKRLGQLGNMIFYG